MIQALNKKKNKLNNLGGGGQEGNGEKRKGRRKGAANTYDRLSIEEFNIHYLIEYLEQPMS